MIAVAGIVCKEKARKGKVNGISDVAHFTIRLIDSRVRTSWSHTGRSWVSFNYHAIQKRLKIDTSQVFIRARSRVEVSDKCIARIFRKDAGIR